MTDGCTDRAAEGLLCHWTSENAGLQGPAVVTQINQQVKTSGCRQTLVPVWTQLIVTALSIFSHLEPTSAAGTKEETSLPGKSLKKKKKKENKFKKKKDPLTTVSV